MNGELAQRLVGIFVVASLLAVTAAAQFGTPPAWRSIGPTNMGGRVVDVAVDPTDVDIWYVASASGGLFKSANAGTTWRPIFDSEATVSIGDIAVAPSDPLVLWVGTGEANARNSVSWGDGVYLSRDGGGSWTNVGLRNSFQIGRIAVHPERPLTALVAACGRLWGANAERGVFRTTDGGGRWEHVLAVDDETGAVDVLIDPSDPDRVYAATWRRLRGAFDISDPTERFGEGAGIWRSLDGGETWSRLTDGLPTCRMGRIGLALAPSQPRTLYAIIATERLGSADGSANALRSHEERLGGQLPNKQGKQGAAGFESGGLFRSDDGGDSWRRVNSVNPRPYYYSQVRVDPLDPERVWILGTNIDKSSDGGETIERDTSHGLHVDFHALWIDPQDPEHMLVGGDGGVAFSVDRGASWRHFDNFSAAQYYRVAVDNERPYRIYGGLQDNGSWVVPSQSWHADGVLPDQAFCIGWGDGFTALPHPEISDLWFYSSQYGSLYYGSRYGPRGQIGQPQAEGGERIRSSWDTPYLIDPHDADRLWVGAHRVFRVDERGAGETAWASPELPATMSGAISALAASAKMRRLLWAGTSDGKVWYTRNGGTKWKDVTGAMPELPGAYHVSDIECSFASAGTVWVAVDGHRSDDDRVHLFRTTNFGRTWDTLGQGIPSGPVLSLQQGAHNEDLLFAGTEFGVFASIDAGDSWFAVRGDLPTVAVRDFAVQVRDRELVAGTHGRGLFILDIAGLEALSEPQRRSGMSLLPPQPAVLFDRGATRKLWGDAHYRAKNPPTGAAIHYWLRTGVSGSLQLRVTDQDGEELHSRDVDGSAGLHRVFWDLRRDGRRRRRVPSGRYVVELVSAKQTLQEPLEVVSDPLRATADESADARRRAPLNREPSNRESGNRE